MLFDRIKLSNEDFEGAPVDTTEAIIEGDLAYADAMDIAREAMMDATAMDAAQSAVMALDAKIANEEYLLANPEKITTETVVLAQESYRSVAAILGANIEDIEGVVSHESIESSPITALQVSHEGVKDFIVKLYESIKLLFKKIANAIKKVVVKLVVAMNGVEKAAKKLQDSLKKGTTDTPKQSNLPERDGKVWSKYFTAVCAIGSIKKISDDSAAKILITFHTENVGESLAGINTNLKSFADTISKDDADIKKMNDELAKLKAKSDDASKKEYAAMKELIKDNEVIVPVALVNDQIKGLIMTFEDGDDDAKYDVKFKAGSLKTENDVDSEVTALNKTQVTGILTELVTMAKGLKKFSDNRIKEIDSMYKDLDKMAGDKTSNAVSKFLLKQKASFGTNIRALVAGVYLDSVLAYSSATKKLLAYCRDNAKLLKSNEL